MKYVCVESNGERLLLIWCNSSNVSGSQKETEAFPVMDAIIVPSGDQAQFTNLNAVV